MSDKKLQPQNETVGLGRRRFINTAALAGLTVGVAACNDKPAAAPAAAPAASAPPPAPAAASHAGASVHLKPGELDTYYGLWSGGHTGDMRVLGLPSGREIHRIPCFVPDALVGWGITNESKAIMGTKADGNLRYTVADTHHTHASYKDGNYDGRYAWINDKINARIAGAVVPAGTTTSTTVAPGVCQACWQAVMNAPRSAGWQWRRPKVAQAAAGCQLTGVRK